MNIEDVKKTEICHVQPLQDCCLVIHDDIQRYNEKKQELAIKIQIIGGAYILKTNKFVCELTSPLRTSLAKLLKLIRPNVQCITVYIACVCATRCLYGHWN